MVKKCRFYLAIDSFRVYNDYIGFIHILTHNGQARRTQFKTGTASEASQILSWGSWERSLSPPAGVLGGGAPSKIFRGFKGLKLAY